MLWMHTWIANGNYDETIYDGIKSFHQKSIDTMKWHIVCDIAEDNATYGIVLGYPSLI